MPKKGIGIFMMGKGEESGGGEFKLKRRFIKVKRKKKPNTRSLVMTMRNEEQVIPAQTLLKEKENIISLLLLE